jgi:5-formyltetrahydrofolate cyclo-ligase
MNKKEIRKKYKDLRSLLSAEELEEKSLAIANQLLKLAIWQKTYYHLFLSIKKQKEILDTENISEADKLTKMKQIKEMGPEFMG